MPVHLHGGTLISYSYIDFFTGTSEGAILVLCVPTKGCDVIFTRQLQGHSAPVCDLAANGEGLMASADETGTILLWGDPVVNAESIRRIETG